MIPTLKLLGWMPRRIYLPMVCVRGDRARPIYEQVRDSRIPLDIYWQLPSPAKESRYKRATCNFPSPPDSPLVSDPLPPDLWVDSLSPQDLSKEARKQVTKALEIRLVIRDVVDAGLLITWNPAAFPALQQTTPAERIRTLSLVKELDKARSSSPMNLCHSPTLHLPLLVLKKSRGDAPQSVTEEDPRSLPWWDIGSRFFRRDWHFEPRPITLIAERPSLVAEARNMAVVCLDFGTSATAASYIEQLGGSADRYDLQPVRDLRPWSHITILPEFTHLRTVDGKEIGQTFHCYSAHTTWTAENRQPQIGDCVPDAVRKYRQPLSTSDAKRATIPSMLYALPDDAEPVLDQPPDAIGMEVEGLLLSMPGNKVIEAHRFLFAPKLTVSQKPDQFASFDAIRANHSPVKLFLREFFNQLHLKLNRLELPILPIERICYSYPVAWVKHQRDAFRLHLEEAVKESAFVERMIPEEERKVNPYHQGYSMDEASAAFLGFIQYRMGGLEADDLVRAYQPFQPDPEQARTYPKTIRVLIFDSGGGTTDVALLEIIDVGGAAYNSVQSYVRKYFALNKAGLEVTRRIAEHLKDLILDTYPNNSAVREALRTSLLEEGLDKRPNRWGIRTDDGSVLTEADVRRIRTVAFYEEAERLKLKLYFRASEAQAGQEVREPIQWTVNPMLLKGLPGVDANALPQHLSLKILLELIKEVYKPVSDQLARWFGHAEQRIDIVLMTGRSSELPGLRAILEAAIPPNLRPFGFNWITSHNLFLQDPPPGVNRDEAAKTLVQEGLRLLYRNRMNTNTKAVNCNPIDETRRDRAIGVMPQDIKTGRPEPAFHPSADLLVEADGEAVDPNRDVVYDETNPTSKGFFLGINYSGTNQCKQSPSDPPVPFMRIRITGGESDSYRRLRFVFRQQSATHIVLHRLALFTDPDDRAEPEVVQVQSSDSLGEQIAELGLRNGGSLEIRVQPYSSAEDFRLTGRIHLKKPALDDFIA